MDAVADEPGRAGDVEVKKIGGEAVEAGTGGGGSEERVREGTRAGRARESGMGAEAYVQGAADGRTRR